MQQPPVPDIRCTVSYGSSVDILCGDVAEVLAQFPANYFQGCLTDPPYGLNIAGQLWAWDVTLPAQVCWEQVFRVLVPGAHALVYGDPRTYHRLAVGLEDAGFEIRDCLIWLFGNGRPRSRSIAELMSKLKANEGEAKVAVEFLKERRESLEMKTGDVERTAFGKVNRHVYHWELGTSLPEPSEWVQVVKALGLESTPFDEVMAPGYDLLEVREGNFWNPNKDDRWRGEWKLRDVKGEAKNWENHGTGLRPGWLPVVVAMKPLGTVRFPGNAEKWGVAGLNLTASAELHDPRHPVNVVVNADAGMDGAISRYFFATKATAEERHRGCENIEAAVVKSELQLASGDGCTMRGNPHTSVKPLELNRYLAKLLLPPSDSAQLLNPFAGSGSEAIAGLQVGFRQVTAIERDPVFSYVAARRAAGILPAKVVEVSPAVKVPTRDGPTTLPELLLGEMESSA